MNPRIARISAFATLLLVTQTTACVRTKDSPPPTKQPAQVAAEPVPVTVARVIVRPSQRVLKFVGTLFGDEEVALSSQVEGQIKALHVDLGDHVEAGQPLAEIDDLQLRARMRELDAMLAKARADEARGRALVGNQVISPQEYEAMKTAVAVAEAQRDTITVMIDHARVLSPITGSVATRKVSAGEYVRAGTLLFNLVADQPLKLRGEVPERFAQEIATGQPVQIQVDAFPDQDFGGTLARISPTVNRENRSITVEALVDNGNRRLKPGFFANASIVTRADDEALMVPQTAVVTFAGVTRLFVVEKDVVHQRQIQTGSRGAEGLVEVIDGVARDEVVATSGLTKLENGAPVTIRATDG